MCTSISFKTKDHYFGRNLDLEYSYVETITITPRNFPLVFRQKETLHHHYAMIGTAFVQDNYPLYYDATNEVGLSMAGLNFPDYAYYFPSDKEKDNITPFEFIPWILSQCATISEAKTQLKNLNLLDEAYSKQLPLSPLHWIIADKHSSIVVESTESGLHIYDNPVGVLTNSPSFHMQLENLNSHTLLPIGLPGDWTSKSRFVRAAYLLKNSISGILENESVHQFFHLLSGVEFPRGCIKAENGTYKITIYSSCCNTDKGIYYFKTYDNQSIRSISMQDENLDDTKLITYPMDTSL